MNTEKVTWVHHWTDKTFSFKTTRNKTFRFNNGEFAMIGLMVDDKPLLRAYSIASANFEDELMVIDGVDEETASELQTRAREFIEKETQEALEKLRGLGVEEALLNFDGLSPQMLLALADDDIKSVEEFAKCADWELAGGWTTVDGERVKDDGLLENFGLGLEEAQDLIMTARVILGWVNPDDIAPTNSSETEEEN